MIRHFINGAKGSDEDHIYQIIYDDEKKIICKINCDCPGFSGIIQDKDGNLKNIGSKRIKEFLSGPETKYYSDTPCEHLRKNVNILLSKGYTFKKYEMEGFDECPNWLRKKLIEKANGHCEHCGQETIKFNIHRKVRGSNGGKYNEWNCRAICDDCHRFIHGNEFKHIQGK